MTQKENKMRLPKISVDELFSTQEQRDNEEFEKIVSIPIGKIHDFANHPFKVIVNDELLEMVDSIKQKGVISPALVRPKGDGSYEMVSGHRRKKASELAYLITLPCIVRELTDDEATIIMVDSNLQREELLPSEKAFSYKMRLEAMNRQGMRTDATSVPLAQKYKNKTSREQLGELVGESQDQVRRYIRLTELVPEILEMVDEKRIAFRPAVEISYLNHDEQYILSYQMEYLDATPSLAQAISLKKMSQEGVLTTEKIEGVMEQEKPNQTPKVKISRNKLEKLLPKNVVTERQVEEFVLSCVEEHVKRLKQRNNEAR